MSRVKSKGNRSTEILFLSLLKQAQITGWRRHYDIIGKPDFAFPKLKIAVFVDGAFWHGHPSSPLPGSNREFWKVKIEQNRKRDEMVNQALKKKGWWIARVWDFELKKSPFVALGRVKRLISLRKNNFLLSKA